MAAPVWQGYGGTVVDDSTTTGGHWSSTEPTSGGGLPSGLSAGDVMLAFVTTRDTAYTIGTPNGWTSLVQSTSNYCAVFGRAWQSGDTAPSFDWTNGGSPYSVVIARISGADTNVANWVVGTPNTGTSATVTAPSVNTPTPDSLVVRLYYQSDNNTTDTPPGSHTLGVRTSTAIGSDAMFAVYWIAQASQGSSGTADCVFSASDPYWGETIAIGLAATNAPAGNASAAAAAQPAGASIKPAAGAATATATALDATGKPERRADAGAATGAGSAYPSATKVTTSAGAATAAATVTGAAASVKAHAQAATAAGTAYDATAEGGQAPCLAGCAEATGTAGLVSGGDRVAQAGCAIGYGRRVA